MPWPPAFHPWAPAVNVLAIVAGYGLWHLCHGLRRTRLPLLLAALLAACGGGGDPPHDEDPAEPRQTINPPDCINHPEACR